MTFGHKLKTVWTVRTKNLNWEGIGFESGSSVVWTQPDSSESGIPAVAAADNVFVSLRYLNAIQTMCPHILRYLTTAVITNKDVRKRRQVLKDLVKVIQQVRLMDRVVD